MALASELLTKITADNKQFAKTFADSGSIVSSFASTFSKVIGGLSLIGLAKNFSDVIEKIDGIGDSAARLNITTDAFQQLSYAAKMSDSSMASLSAGMEKLASSVFDAEKNGGSLQEIFKALGLETSKLKGMSLDKMYLAVADALSKVGNSSQQLAMTKGIFGKAGGDQLQIIRGNVTALIAEYDKLGTKLSSTQIENASIASDMKKRFWETFDGVSNKMIADLAPAFTFFVTELSKILGMLTEIGSTGFSKLKQGLYDIKEVGFVQDLQNQTSTLFDHIARGVEYSRNILSNSFDGNTSGFDQSKLHSQIGDPDVSGTRTVPIAVQIEGKIANVAKSTGNSVERFGKEMVVQMGKAMDGVTKWAEAAEKKGGKIESLISGMNDKKSQDNLERILKDFIDPNAKQRDVETYLNKNYQDQVKRANPDMSAEELQKYKVFENPGSGADVSTTRFDEMSKSLFDAIKDGKIDMDEATKRLGNLRGEGFGLGDKSMGVADELEKYARSKLPSLSEDKKKAQEVTIQVLASPDFIVNILNDNGFRATVDSAVLDVAAKAAVMGAR